MSHTGGLMKYRGSDGGVHFPRAKSADNLGGRPPSDFVSKDLEEGVISLNRGSTKLLVDHKTPARFVMEGKTAINHVPLFDSGAWQLNVDTTVNSATKITLNATKDSQFSEVFIGAKEQTNYVLTLNHNALVLVTFRKEDKTEISRIDYSNAQLINIFTPVGTTNIRLVLSNYTLGAGTYTFEDVMINEGTVPTEFIANVQPIRNPAIIVTDSEGKEISRQAIEGSFFEGEKLFWNEEGLPYKEARFREVELDGSFDWKFNSSQTGYKRVHLNPSPFQEGIGGTEYRYEGVKYNGAVLGKDFTINRADMIYLDTGKTYLHLSIPNEDSGWGQTYTPTAEEIKAYFMGWRMYKDAQFNPYDGTGTKNWAYMREDNVYAGATSSCPVLPPTDRPKNGRYRFIYELAEPTLERVSTRGQLQLNKGENNVEVREGIVIKEIVRVKVGGGSTNNTVFMNDTNLEIPFKNKTEKINSIYKNDVLDNQWEIYDSAFNVYGKQKAKKDLTKFNPKDVFTATYEIRNFLSAKISKTDVTYPKTVPSIVENAVDKISDIADRFIEIENSLQSKSGKVNPIKYQLPINPTNFDVANSGGVYFSKNQEGYVHVEIALRKDSYVASTSYSVGFLPVGFRPKETVYQLCSLFSSGGGVIANSLTLVWVSSSGEIIVYPMPGGTFTNARDVRGQRIGFYAV